MLDQVIGEFDDGFLSDADTVRSKRKDPRGQFGFNDKIDQIFDEIYEDSKVERLDNFKISSGPDKGAANADGHEKTPSTEIPAPGTVQAAKRQYLDNVDRNHLDRDRERSRIPDSKVQRAEARGSDTRHSVVSEKTRKSETNVVRRENKSGRGEPDSDTGASSARSVETKCHQVGSDHLLMRQKRNLVLVVFKRPIMIK